MLTLLLFDLAPNPVRSGTGVAGLIVLSFVILTITAAMVVGLVFLLKAVTRGRSNGFRSKMRRLRSTRLMVGDVCLSIDSSPPKPRDLVEDTRQPQPQTVISPQ